MTGLEVLLPPVLGPFVHLVLDRPDLQDELGALADVDSFIDVTLAIAGQHDVAVPEEVLRSVLRPDPLGLGRFAAAPITLDRWPPRGWLPTRSVPTGGAPDLDWLWFGSRPLTAPFFEDEVRRASFLPINWLLRIRTSLADLVADAGSQESLPLKGLIFHMSRCGSTLAAQMLSAVPAHAVSSEPEPLDAVLRWAVDSGIEAEPADAAVRAIVAALGRMRLPGQTSHFIKLEVWHTHYLPALRRAFEQTNWVYLHRDPVEVLVSLIEQPSMHTLPGVAFDTQLEASDGADFTARALAGYSRAVVTNWGVGGGVALDYPDIARAMPSTVARHFGLSLSDTDRSIMEQAGSRNAKAPSETFSSDSERKRAAAGPEVRAAAEHWLDPIRQTLLAL
ncbi:MAG: sulfotransferase [Novosphingobium sp.]